MKNYRLLASLAAMLLVAGVLCAAVFWQLGYFHKDRLWTIATGAPHGNYHQLGSQLAEMLNRQLRPTQHFELSQSAGSAENMQRIGGGDADFAFVQSNDYASANARLIATLYDEVLHVLVRADLVDDSIKARDLPLEVLAEFDRVSLGPVGSGTNRVAEMLLDHFEVELKMPALHAPTSKLATLFDDGELDAAFVLAAPGSRHTEELLDSESVRLLSMGQGALGGAPVDAFALLHPTFQACIIPARLYGRQPRQAVQTIGVSALLVASADVEFNVVRRVTRELFAHRSELFVGEDTPLQLSQNASNTTSSIPLHAGAEAFYHRENPSFLVVYAEVIALGITLLVGIWSIARLFLRWLADVKKERIDAFYREVRDAAHLEGDERLTALHAIHQRAFDQLMAERLIANESFVIFHDYLLSEIARAERTA